MREPRRRGKGCNRIKPFRTVKKRGVVGLGVVLVAAAAMAGYALFLVPCSGFHQCPDTPQLVALEQRELMPRLREIFNRNKAVRKSFDERTPEPLQVRVSQKNAILTTSGPIYESELEYAEAWYDVYRRHHPGAPTVYLNVVWPSGSVKQYFPISTLRVPPPRDVRERVAATS
jgi:hypothetical protein